MAVQGIFYGLPLTTLQPLLSQYLNALTAIATRGEAYTVSGRSYKSGDLPEVRNTIAELQSAIDRLNGVRTTNTYPRFTGPYPQ